MFYSEKRASDVKKATDSIVVYEQWRESKDPELLESTPEVVAIVPERAMGGQQLVRILDRVAHVRGLPKAIIARAQQAGEQRQVPRNRGGRRTGDF